MIVLDTNVISELRNRRYSDHLLTWLDGIARGKVFLTTVSIAEIHFGIGCLPEGHRKADLADLYRQMEAEFNDRILVFSVDAAHRYGKLTAERRSRGHPIDTKDAMIAATCLSHGATLATRNVKDFEGLDLRLVNPFEGA